MSIGSQKSNSNQQEQEEEKRKKKKKKRRRRRRKEEEEEEEEEEEKKKKKKKKKKKRKRERGELEKSRKEKGYHHWERSSGPAFLKDLDWTLTEWCRMAAKIRQRWIEVTQSTLEKYTNDVSDEHMFGVM